MTTTTTRPASLGHTCIHQEAPGAPTCDRTATVDLQTVSIVRAYCDAHVPADDTIGRELERRQRELGQTLRLH